MRAIELVKGLECLVGPAIGSLELGRTARISK